MQTGGVSALIEGATSSTVVAGSTAACGIDAGGVAGAGAPFLEAGSCATTSVVWDPTAVPVPSLAAVAGVSVGQWHACAFDADGARKG